jgi:hypothetical protein
MNWSMEDNHKISGVIASRVGLGGWNITLDEGVSPVNSLFKVSLGVNPFEH